MWHHVGFLIHSSCDGHVGGYGAEYCFELGYINYFFVSTFSILWVQIRNGPLAISALMFPMVLNAQFWTNSLWRDDTGRSSQRLCPVGSGGPWLFWAYLTVPSWAPFSVALRMMSWEHCCWDKITEARCGRWGLEKAVVMGNTRSHMRGPTCTGEVPEES